MSLVQAKSLAKFKQVLSGFSIQLNKNSSDFCYSKERFFIVFVQPNNLSGLHRANGIKFFPFFTICFILCRPTFISFVSVSVYVCVCAFVIFQLKSGNLWWLISLWFDLISTEIRQINTQMSSA